MSSVFKSKLTTAPQGAIASNLELSYFTYREGNRDGTLGLAMALIRAAQDMPEETWNAELGAAYILTVGNLIFPGLAAVAGAAPGVTLIEQRHELSPSWFDTEWTPEPREAAFPAERPEAGIDGGLFPDLEIVQEFQNLSRVVLGGRWGIEMFPIGKNVSREGLTGFTVNRVNAVTRKHNLPAEQVMFFQGAFAPHYSVLKAVELAFNSYPPLREALAREWISWVAGFRGEAENAFAMTFALTDGFGFSGPTVILDLLVAYPELRRFPPLKPEIQAFDDAMDEYRAASENDRGFLKVIHGDRYNLFKGSNRRALLAIAVINAQNTQPTMSRFVNTTQYLQLAAQVNNFLTQEGLLPLPIAGGGTAGPARAGL